MATEGLIDLDAPASRYLQGLTFINPWADISRVTVRHLLDHTSGLNDAQMWQMFSERTTPDTPLADAFPEPAKTVADSIATRTEIFILKHGLHIAWNDHRISGQ